jgi:hypothetical protein
MRTKAQIMGTLFKTVVIGSSGQGRRVGKEFVTDRGKFGW